MPNLNSKAILDSGSTISLLPDDQVRKLWREFNVVSDKQVIAPFIDCSYAGEKGEGYVFEFRFDNKTIQVPIHEMVIDAYADYQTTFLLDERFSDFESVCMFGIGSTADFGIDTDQFTLLGATFLRSAYVVYDLANKQLGLAQANLNETDSDIIEVKSDDLPEVTGVASQASQTGPSRTDSAGSGSTGGSGDGDDDEDHAAGGIAPPAMAAMTVMGLVGAVIVAL